MKKLLIALLIGFFALNASAQSVWNPLNSGTESNLLAVDFIDSMHGMAVGDEGTILKTSDGGESWQLIDAGILGSLYAISYINAQNVIITGGNGLILKSGNGGESWQQKTVQGISVDLLAVDMLESGSGLACGLNQTILWTCNSGEDWTILRTDWLGTFYSAHILEDSLAFVYGENSIFNHLIGKVIQAGDSLDFSNFYINNNGALTEGMIHAGYHFDADSCVTAGAIFPGIAAITCNQPWGQNTWNACFLQEESYLTGLDFVGEYGVSVGGPNIIVESYDSGHNWTELIQTIKKDDPFRAVKLIDSSGYIVGDKGTILKKETAQVNPPEIDIFPPLVTQTLGTGETATQILTIENNGGDLLEYSLNINFTSPDLCTNNLYEVGCQDGDGITLWFCAGVNVPLIPCSGSSSWYHNYTHFNHLLTSGETYTLTLQSGYDNTFFDVWIDFNDDLLLTEDELIVDDGYFTSGGTNFTFDFSIPVGANQGRHVMRFRTNWDEQVNDACDTYEFGNCCDFTATIGEVSPADWLSLDIASGLVEPGNSQEITLTFDAEGLENSTYEKTISISSNDPQNFEVEVPVVLNVEPVSISEIVQSVVEIFPNPANDELSIKINNSKSDMVLLTIMDATGQTTVEKTFTDKTNLNISSYAGGIYFIKINIGTYNEVRKIIIK